MYFKDPYKKYYDALINAQMMITMANQAVDSSIDAFRAVTRLQSMVETAQWIEMGHQELISNSIPMLKRKTDLLKNNISENLSPAVTISINNLLPILAKIKTKDAELQEINARLSALIEPVNGDDVQYSSYWSEKSRLSSMADKLIKELELHIEEADIEIENIKALNGGVIDFLSLLDAGELADMLGIDLDSFNLADGENGSLKITNVEYFDTNDKSMSGNYFVVTFSNGKKLYLHQQKDGTGGKWNAIDIGKDELWNGGGGCSVFATSAAFSWLLNQYIPPRSVMMAGGGQLPGIRDIATDHSPVLINGEKYIIDATVSEINVPYGSTSNKEDVVNDWYDTLKSGGVVVIAVGGRNEPIKEYYNDGKNAKIIESSGDINERTGINSKQGHVITMVGLDDDGKIIFADSMFDVDNDDNGNYSFDNRAYNKGLTPDEFYDLYGGRGKTYIDSSDKTYVTIKNATITKVA